MLEKVKSLPEELVDNLIEEASYYFSNSISNLRRVFSVSYMLLFSLFNQIMLVKATI